MTLVFEQIVIPKGTDIITGVFITQESYRDLLQLVDSYFSLGMLTTERKLPCAKHSYMVISKGHDVWKHVGTKVSVTINKLQYNETYGYVIACAQLKTNFTCNSIPHIVLAKKETLNRATVNRLLTSTTNSYTVNLETPYKASGRIGVLLGSGEELVLATNQGVVTDVVKRPEITHSVEQPVPEDTITVEVYATKALERAAYKEKVPDSGPKEMYKGCPVIKGPRGGKYIIKDGKKIYVHGECDKPAGAQEGPVYKINMLE